jgi:hypothetical protein
VADQSGNTIYWVHYGYGKPGLWSLWNLGSWYCGFFAGEYYLELRYPPLVGFMVNGVRFSIVLFLATAATGHPKACAQDLSVWDQDLATAGYSRPDDYRNRLHLSGIKHPILFLSEKRIAVTFLVRGAKAGLTTHEHPGASYVIKTAFLDVASGAMEKTKIWSNAADHFDLVPAGADQFAVVDRNETTLYSESLEQIAGVKHKVDTVFAEGPSPNRKMFPDLNYSTWALESSPTGKTLVAIHQGGSMAMLSHFSADHLQPLGEFTQSSFLSSATSDEFFAYTEFDHRRDVSELYIRPLAGSSADVRKVDVQRCTDPAFIGDGFLLVTGTCSYLLLIDTTGQRAKEKILDQNPALRQEAARSGQRMASRPVSSSNGRRFAVTEFQFVKGSSWRDKGPSSKDVSIVVYDVAGMVPVFSLPQTAHVFVLGYALSPDGSLLAVLRDNLLSLYRVDKSAGSTSVEH